MFIFQVIISFIIGGLCIALQTLLAERVPLKWRGIVLTIPTTGALGFFFVGLTKGAAQIPEVATTFPAALGAVYIFILAFAYFSRFGLLKASIVSYLIWALGAYFILSYPPENFAVATFIYMLPITLVAYFLIKKLPQVTNLTPVPFNTKHLLIRSLIGGTVIATVVILSKTLGNIWGGLFSAFPAAFSATFLIYYSVHGKAIIPSVGKSLFFPGAIVFVLYAWSAAFFFPLYGIWLGTLFSYIIVVVFYLIRMVILSKNKI